MKVKVIYNRMLQRLYNTGNERTAGTQSSGNAWKPNNDLGNVLIQGLARKGPS